MKTPRRTIKDTVPSANEQRAFDRTRSNLLKLAPEFVVEAVIQGLEACSESIARGSALERIRISLGLQESATLDEICAAVESITRGIRVPDLPTVRGPRELPEA